jgi:hypothetical protein
MIESVGLSRLSIPRGALCKGEPSGLGGELHSRRSTMSDRTLVGVILLSLACAPATAQQAAPGGQTSGAAVGGNVAPSAVLQKRFEGRLSFIDRGQAPSGFEASAVSAGAPGVEGKPGAQSGAAPREREEGAPIY